MTSTESPDHLPSLVTRLRRLEAAHEVRNTLGRYMLLCDQPCGDRAFPQLADLFTSDATWEGAGTLYAGTFGRHQGREAIASFVQGYLAPSTHFKRNLHFLTSGQVAVADDCGSARGQWLMLQLSTYGSGGSEAITARLDIAFAPDDDGRWLISHFRTERLECAPWHAAHGEELA